MIQVEIRVIEGGTRPVRRLPGGVTGIAGGREARRLVIRICRVVVVRHVAAGSDRRQRRVRVQVSAPATCAATTTWLINRVVVFSSTHRQPRRLLTEWAAYFVASLGGGCLNYLVFVIAVRVSPLLHHIPSIAVGLGSLAGTSFNFLMYARYVFGASGPMSKQDSPG